MSAGSIVTVTAEIYPDERQMEIIGILLEEFKLVLKEEMLSDEKQIQDDEIAFPPN
jgi:hypothetical protein